MDKTPLVIVAFWSICPQSGFWQSDERASVFVRESAVLGYALDRHTDKPFLLNIAYLYCVVIFRLFICTQCPVILGQAVYSRSAERPRVFLEWALTLSLRHFAEAVMLFARAQAGKCFYQDRWVKLHIGGNTIFTNAQSQTFKHKSEWRPWIMLNTLLKPQFIFFV